ncbi:putative sperm motility kinase W, partial [Grammomys surdaster]|uniref:putative sperm motility kinase W n=1 Tax=Grammomys surdaster TaxID=491861 RepID=UPI0010A0713C
ARKIFGQVVSAVKYCHSLDIVHLDIKPQNVLRDEVGNVKLIDFGLATKCTPGTLLNRYCGTRSCFSPEIALRVEYDGKKSDVWSLGVLLFFITIGHYPFRGITVKEVEEKITTGTYDIPSHVPGQLENLIHQLLTVSPEMRPSIENIEKHPWVIKCEVDIPTEINPDYNIIDRLCGMGFDANEIIESLHNKKYNEPMAAYLIIKAQVEKRHEDTSTASFETDQCPIPPPSPAHPSTSGLPLKKRASEPNFSLLHIQPSRKQVPVALTRSQHNVARSVSMPPISLEYSENKTSSTSTCALYYGAVAAPSVCNIIEEDELNVPPEQDFDIKTPSPPKKTGRFKRVTKRIRACLSRLCCFPCARKKKTQDTSSKEVAPLKEAGGRTQ